MVIGQGGEVTHVPGKLIIEHKVSKEEVPTLASIIGNTIVYENGEFKEAKPGEDPEKS
jgi:hypothetical protein